jgi:hypothetical protein
MSEIYLYYPEIKIEKENSNVSIDDMMDGYTRDITTLQARIAELESDIPFEQACKRIVELEEAIREFILIEGIKDYTPGYDVMYDMGLSLLKKTIGVNKTSPDNNKPSDIEVSVT